MSANAMVSGIICNKMKMILFLKNMQFQRKKQTLHDTKGQSVTNSGANLYIFIYR